MPDPILKKRYLILYENTLLTKWLSLQQKKMRVELKDTRLYVR